MATNLTIGGAQGGKGLVGIPVSFPDSVSAALQNYLSQLSDSLPANGGSAGFINIDANTGATASTAGGSTIEEITNTDPNSGSISGGYATGVYTVAPQATVLIVQAPGVFTVYGSSSLQAVIAGANTTIDYIVDNQSTNTSIYAAGGSDTVTLDNNASDTNTTYVYGAEGTNLQLLGGGSVSATLDGSLPGGATNLVNIGDENVTLTATGNDKVGIFWANKNAGGTLDFVNTSSNAATVFTSFFGTGSTGHAAFNTITVNAGQGGGYYVGGLAGDNSFVGGVGTSAGAVTFIGGNGGDIMKVQGGTNNVLFAGLGNETLTATSLSGSNLFEIGNDYPGTDVPNSNGIASTAGTGTQTFFLGNSDSETIYGSTAKTATNIYNVIGDSTAGGGNFVINNFVGSSSTSAGNIIYLENGSDNGSSDASIKSIISDPVYSNSTEIVLSDHTQIHLIGVSASSLTVATVSGAAGPITAIYNNATTVS